jgi:hypothetical protein
MLKITSAPLPKWSDLGSAVLAGGISNEELSKPWRRDGESALWFSRSSWSLANCIRWRQKKSPDKTLSIWLPAYFCNSALAQLRNTGVNLVFYTLAEDMSPDMENCVSLLEEHSVDVFVLVHYFGKAVSVDQAFGFCKEQNAWLIEDAAHILRPVPGIGEHGDWVMYSPHKHLAIPDGAVLVQRRDGPSNIQFDALSEISCFDDSFSKTSRSGAFKWLIKRILQKLGIRRFRFMRNFDAYEENLSASPTPQKMSWLAKRLLSVLINQLDQISDFRQERLKEWQSILWWTDNINILPIDGITGSPYMAGFRLPSREATETWFRHFQDLGIPVSTWPDLPPEVLSDEFRSKDALNSRHTRLFLPVHQSISQKQILAMVSKMQSDLNKQWKIQLVTNDQWAQQWQNCVHTNLPQAWEYGTAKKEADGWETKRILFSNTANVPVALVQVLFRSIPVLGGIARINRGPLLIGDRKCENAVISLDVIYALLRYARKQHWWIIQVAPELHPSTETDICLKAMGLKKLRHTPWGSAIISLAPDENELLMQLKGKWRNGMRKGQKNSVIALHKQLGNKSLKQLLANYSKMQVKRNFDGLSDELIQAMARQESASWQFNMFVATEKESESESDPLGFLVTVRTGDTSVYCIGTTNDLGRNLQANSVLLWAAVLHAKATGCSWFDLGGLNADTPKGIADFKRGLKGVPYSLTGEWRNW